MKVINSKLAAIGLAAFVFASCSDSASDNGGTDSPSTLDATTIGLTQSDAASLASRVTNYKNSTANARKFFSTRADASFPAATDGELIEETGALALNGAADLVAGKSYYIQGKDAQGNYKTIDLSSKTIDGATIFVHSGCTLIIGDASNVTIYLGYKDSEGNHKGGTLQYTGSGDMIAANSKVVSYFGEIKAKDDNTAINIAGKFYGNYRGTSEKGQTLQSGIGAVENKTTPKQDITFKKGAVAYVDGSIRAVNLTIEEGANVYTTANVMNATKVDLNGALKVDGFLKAATLNVKGNLVASETSSAVKVTKELNMENGGVMTANYINVSDNTYKDNGETLVKQGDATLNLKSGSTINLANKGVVFVNNLVTDNASVDQITLGTAGSIAVVKADKFTYTGDAKIQAFTTPAENSTLLFQFNESYYGTTKKEQVDLDLGCSYYDYDQATNGSAVKLKDDDNTQYGYTLAIEADQLINHPKLDLYASLNSEGDGQSASSILPYSNGKIYVAYHTQSNTFGGNIEVASMASNKLTVESSAKQSVATYDFNHLNVIDGKLYLSGSNKGGAIVGYVGLNGDGSLNTTDGFKAIAIDNKTQGDANCVESFGGNIVVANTKGYDIIAKDLSTDQNVSTAGKAKFVVANGSNLVGLNYANAVTAGDAAVNGTIQVFNSNDLSSTSSTISVGEIAPNNGKNMVAVDSEGSIYVCKSAKGLACYKNGTQSWEWVTPIDSKGTNSSVDNRQGYVNGVAVDNNYVYVAAGAYGLVVLSKDGKTVVAHRNIDSLGSANYVAVKDGNIYVAYGKNRIQVFKLTTTK